MKLVLYTIKEYCKKYRITDAGARKRVQSKSVKSVILDETQYIVIESNDEENLKNKVKLLQSKVREITSKLTIQENTQDTIQRLNDKIESLETKLEAQYSKKEELYEKVLNTVMIANKTHQD